MSEQNNTSETKNMSGNSGDGSREGDDYESDVRFGQWLRSQRTGLGLSLEQAADQSGVSLARLKSLEMGYSEKGITQVEAQKLGKAYRLDLKQILEQAVSDS